jgi:hypothetical protein
MEIMQRGAVAHLQLIFRQQVLELPVSDRVDNDIAGIGRQRGDRRVRCLPREAGLYRPAAN